MPTTPARPNSVLEAERACRSRKQDAFKELKNTLEALPEDVLLRYLTQLDPSLINKRRELSQAQVYSITTMIIR
jgi:hypothetical protein